MSAPRVPLGRRLGHWIAQEASPRTGARGAREPPGNVGQAGLMTRRDLLVTIRGSGYGDDTQVLRVHIANLRRKIEPPGAGTSHRHIRTDPGVGYRFAG